MTPEQAAKRLSRKLGVDYIKYAMAALYEEGHKVIEVTIPITPMLDGFLRQSAFVDLEPRPFTVEVGFGGFAAKYALAVHEMGTDGTKINWTEPGTGNKYLERGANKAAKGMTNRIARQVTANAKADRKTPRQRKPKTS